MRETQYAGSDTGGVVRTTLAAWRHEKVQWRACGHPRQRIAAVLASDTASDGFRRTQTTP